MTQQLNTAMAIRMKTKQDMKQLTEERNAAMQEYNLIMSERDTVHKEMEKLTEDKTQAIKKIKMLENESKQFLEEVLINYISRYYTCNNSCFQPN